MRQFEFGKVFGEDAVAAPGRTSRWQVPPGTTSLRRLALADVAVAPRLDAPAAAAPTAHVASPALPPPPPPQDLLLGEAELARACAAVAARTRRHMAELAARQRHDAELVLMDELRRAIAELAGRGRATDQALRERLLQWTMAGLETCIGTLIAVDAVACVARVLERLLEEAAPNGALTVLVHPTLVEGLRARVPDLASVAGLGDEIRVVPDSGLEPGSVRLDWQDGWADHDVPAWRTGLEAELRRRLGLGPADDPLLRRHETHEHGDEA